MTKQTNQPSHEVKKISEKSTTVQADPPSGEVRNFPDNSATDTAIQGNSSSNEEINFSNTATDQTDRPSDGVTNTLDNSATDEVDQENSSSDKETNFNNTTSDQADQPSDTVKNSLANSRKVLKSVPVTTVFRICLALMIISIVVVGMVFGWWWVIHLSIS